MDGQYDINMVNDVTNTKIVTFLCSKYKDTYRCSNRGIFWVFDGIRWQRFYKNAPKSNDSVRRSGSLKRLLFQTDKFAEILILDLTKYYDDLIERYKHNPIIVSGKQINIQLVLRDIISKFHTSAFRKEITEDLRQMIYKIDPEFKNKLDSKKYLIGFDNGVYDLEKKVFRNGQMDDYVSLSTGYDFIEQIFDDGLMQFLESIECNEDLLHYIASCLISRNQICMFGSNNKLLFIELIKSTFGEYFMMFLDKPEDVSLLKKKRFAYCMSNKISPFMQRLMCGEPIEYKKGKTFKADTSIAILCDDKLIDCAVEFIGDAKINVKEVDDWKQKFMLLLLRYV
mgnify:CR=1 FL=1|uniref:Bacteriophage/plasmid primase P4 C-terminal domain-containing protein n=1 Tax=viral metagenome TaxID=1070528 RepID=A0A6C0C8U2_9ZZZZ